MSLGPFAYRMNSLLHGHLAPHRSYTLLCTPTMQNTGTPAADVPTNGRARIAKSVSPSFKPLKPTRTAPLSHTPLESPSLSWPYWPLAPWLPFPPSCIADSVVVATRPRPRTTIACAGDRPTLTVMTTITSTWRRVNPFTMPSFQQLPCPPVVIPWRTWERRIRPITSRQQRP